MFKLFDPNSEYFAKYDTFCPHIFNYACLRRKRHQNIFENGWWEDAYPSFCPGPKATETIKRIWHI